MSFAAHAVADICRVKNEGRKTLEYWSGLNHGQVLRRICTFAGIRSSTIVLCGLDQDKLVRLLAEELTIQVCTRLHLVRIHHQKMYSALWAYIMPQERKKRTKESTLLWKMQMVVGITISCGTLLDFDKRPCIKQVLRLVPPEVQKAIYDQKMDSPEMVKFVRNNMSLLLEPTTYEGAVYVALHGKSKVWYIGKTSAEKGEVTPGMDQHCGDENTWDTRLTKVQTNLYGTRLLARRTWGFRGTTFWKKCSILLYLECADLKVPCHLRLHAPMGGRRGDRDHSDPEEWRRKKPRGRIGEASHPGPKGDYRNTPSRSPVRKSDLRRSRGQSPGTFASATPA